MREIKCPHEPRFTDSVTRCILCEGDDAIRHHKFGIATGLRMAAEMLKNRKRSEWGHQVPIDGFDFYQEILAKAKEVEEGKIESKTKVL